MLAFQRAGKAIKASPGTATLVRALAAAPITHVQIQHCSIHDKVPVDHDAIKHAKPASESGNGPTQDSTSKATKPTIVTTAVVEKTDSLSGDEFWRKVPIWKDVGLETFISYRWTIANMVQGKDKFYKFLSAVLPNHVPSRVPGRTLCRDEVIRDVFDGVNAATMAIRMTPYVLSRINWEDPLNDPIFCQFIPTKSKMEPDHPKLTLDSLHETEDSPVKGLVHRYPDKALFLPTSVCPTYCMFCTRSYAVGADTDSVTKASLKPTRKRWDEAFAYIEKTKALQDIVISGGDAYYLQPEHIMMIGDKLISMDNIKRFRFASKGLAVSPNRVLDKNDKWVDAMIAISDKAKKAGKAMALHTHFNHPNEISWITRKACQKLFEAGVMVRNQAVLLRGVNDDVDTMSRLIRDLADMAVFPYYVYQCDMVEKVEHLRTPVQTILDIEAQIRGSIAGFMMPQFVVDLPGGGGKRLACSFKSYDRKTGLSTFEAPAVKGKGKDKKVYEYWDPICSLPDNQTPQAQSAQEAEKLEYDQDDKLGAAFG